MSQPANESHDAGEDMVTDATRNEEEAEAETAHDADRAPTAEEEAAADGNELDPAVAAHEREMDRIGAEVKGEGEVG